MWPHLLCLLYAPSPRKYNAGTAFVYPQNPGFFKKKRAAKPPIENENGGCFHTPSVSSAEFSIFSAPSSAPSMMAKYCSGQSFSLWLIRCRCALSSRMTSGLKYCSTGSPHTLISCMMTGRAGIVPLFSIFARYRESILTISANVLRDRCFAILAALHLHRKFQNQGNLQCSPYSITHLHCIFHTLPVECCYMRYCYILFFIILAVRGAGKALTLL